MKLELKNIKVILGASHETFCFTATAYIDGKRAFTVENDGQGGADYTYQLNGQSREDFNRLEDAARDYVKSLTYEFMGETRNHNLETYFGDILNEHMQDKEIKKILRKIAYVKEGRVYTLPAKWKPTVQNLKNLQKAGWWKPEFILLNGKPLEELRGYF